MAKISMTKVSSSGISLGGIGSGSVELLPDGEFHAWQIANPPRWTDKCFEAKVDDGEGNTGALSFWVRAKAEGNRPVVRKLGMRTEADDFSYRMFAWNKPVERIDFDGRFPVCDLNYVDSALPCRVTGRAVAPFVPHQSDIAATPGFYMDFELENTSDVPQSVSLLGALEPNFANREGCTNSSVRWNDTVGVFMNPAVPSQDANCGNLCLSIDGAGKKSYITAEFSGYIREYIQDSHFGVSQESILFDFRENGCLPDSEIGVRPEAIPDNLPDLKDEKIDSLYDVYRAYPSVDSMLRRIRHTNPAFPTGRAEKEDFLSGVKEQLDDMTWRGKAYFGGTALCSSLELKPGEKKTVRFVLTWYFPNHFSKYGNRLGHYYENLYSDAADANRFLSENSEKVFDRAVEFADLLYRTNMPDFYPDCWSGHLATIVKNSWYQKNGKFGLWEGLGYCGFHTMDITYHASFGLLALFPDLQMKQMRMSNEFQREDGRVHHFFTPDLDHVDDGYDRVDMNNQYVLMVLRDYLYTGDSKYLNDMWPHVVRAMDSIEDLDRNGDGLPDYGTRRNTYDAWSFSGTPVYISVLWLAALKAAVILAQEMNDAAQAEKWAGLLEKGKFSLDELLWNGEYYNLWRNGDMVDECLMTDQLDGEWFLRAAGIGGNLSDDRVRAVLETIFRHNFDPEQGLINATCLPGKRTSLATYKNCQCEAVWTGIGYAMAALCLYVGMRETADMEVESIHYNQMRLGALWDHWECGHHYTRPLSSWSTLTAALGLAVNRKEKTIVLHPVDENMVAPLCIPDCLATVYVENGKCRIECVKGDLSDWKIVEE